ncbi:MAG: acyl-CoA thioesterase [Pirellulaceae bacterium]|nr:acyl-CoA thioesterase [Pirellulaceae bacterium]
MASFFDLHHTVLPSEIDTQQHVHNLRYLQWTLWAAGEHSKACGWDRDAAMQEGYGWVVRSHDVTYRAAAVAGDEIIVRTWVSDAARFASRRKYVVCRPADKTVLTRVETRWVYVNLKEHKVVAIPDDVRAQITIAQSVPPLPWEQADDQ